MGCMMSFSTPAGAWKDYFRAFSGFAAGTFTFLAAVHAVAQTAPISSAARATYSHRGNLPIYRSTDNGETWRFVSEVPQRLRGEIQRAGGTTMSSLLRRM
jgi:hypothetical protein